MSAQVDTTSKLSYLLPTGTFLTFQVLAPLTTNNGQCGLTEQILTAVALALLVVGCFVTNFTDSYPAEDGKVHIGIVTRHGLWVPGYGARQLHKQASGDSSEDKTKTLTKETDKSDHEQARGDSFKDKTKTGTKKTKKRDDFIDDDRFTPLRTDYINAVLSAVAFLSLTMFTDPVSSCFYPHLSGTLQKALPVLLATVLSFCCSFVTKVRHGFGNFAATPANPTATAAATTATTAATAATPTVPARANSPADVANNRGENAV